MASWDEATAVPSRVVTSLPAVRATADAAEAERLARQLLAEHLDLWAPGAAPSDFVLAANAAYRGIRVVSFFQHHRGLRVLGGQLSFRFKNDRLVVIGSEAFPRVRARIPERLVSWPDARSRAARWIASDRVPSARASGGEGPFILPLVRPGGSVDYRTVLAVTVSSENPTGRWSVYVDAATAKPVARQSTLRFAQGTVLYDAPERWPGAERIDYPAPLAEVEVNGVADATDEGGLVDWEGEEPATVVTEAHGALATVDNVVAQDARATLSLPPGGAARWSAADDELVDAQLSAFIHASRAKLYAASFAELDWLWQSMPIHVNIVDTCNAYYDGHSINFFRSGDGCENTARLADIVYHELGHGLHAHAVIPGAGAFDAAAGEGIADFFAVTITDDPAMGPGFYQDEEPLRHLDPPSGERVWPDDVGYGPHETGLILGGALWDLRQALVDELGEAEGVATANELFYLAIRTAVDIPSMYVELLLADDDDGDLSNGTPHSCAIDQSFGAHGLRAITAEVPDQGAVPHQPGGFVITARIQSLTPSCADEGVAQVTLYHRLRDSPSSLRHVPMSGGPVEFSATIPAAPRGQVIQYALVVELSDAGLLYLPNNPADLYYELFVGEVEPLYCTGFETDPTLDGWTHGAAGGPAGDDWQWGAPKGTRYNTDPPEARSGSRVLGNDLGGAPGDAHYLPSQTSYATSPLVEVGDFDHVRLQYWRWLNVQDGFFDRATIYAYDQPLWQNLDSNQAAFSVRHHRDREWRFHDVDLSTELRDGAVQVRFELASDGAVQLGGWTLDELCVVGVIDGTSTQEPTCGDGLVQGDEQCDDGNRQGGDGCDADCQLEPGGALEAPPPLNPGCACRMQPERTRAGGPALLLLGLLAACLFLTARPPRRNKRAL